MFDRLVMVDWSGGNDTGPTPRKDAIWLCESGQEPIYLRNRAVAEAEISRLMQDAMDNEQRILFGFDFPFGYPKGFAHALTGEHAPFAVWDWLSDHIEDTPKANNRFQVAGQINAKFPGVGPFWFNAVKDEIADLPRKDTRSNHGMVENRHCDSLAKGAFTCWQLGGAGAVGGQVLTGLPVLNRLRKKFADQVAVWPFEALTPPIAFVEIWPGLINNVVKVAEAEGGIRDAHQVQILARAMSGLGAETLDALLAIDAPEEGWIFGLGHEDVLSQAAVQLQPPPLRNDCFALPPGVDWTPVDEAMALLQSRLAPVVAAKSVPVMAAAGRVLAEDVLAERANPPLPNTAVDGYGFAGGFPDSAPHRLPLIEGRAAAGLRFEGVVPEGHAIRILTGAALPEGVDTVVLEEDVAIGKGEIAFRGPVKTGANTRKAGEDVQTGDVALQKGRTLTPADLALAAAVGKGTLPVRDRLKVAVLSTGDELLEAGSPAGPGQIYDANRPMLLSLLHQWGYDPIDMGRVPDVRDTLRQTLDKAAQQADVILTSGGASAGDEDHVSALLRETGSMQEWRIALKPGRPLALGLWDNAPVFGLPGNPVAALVCTLIFARPALRVLSGSAWAQPAGFMVPAAFEKRKKPGRREYLRARMRDGQVETFKSEGSGRISGLSWAEGLVELGDGPAHIQPGDMVRYIPFSSF